MGESQVQRAKLIREMRRVVRAFRKKLGENHWLEMEYDFVTKGIGVSGMWRHDSQLLLADRRTYAISVLFPWELITDAAAGDEASKNTIFKAISAVYHVLYWHDYTKVQLLYPGEVLQFTNIHELVSPSSRLAPEFL